MLLRLPSFALGLLVAACGGNVVANNVADDAGSGVDAPATSDTNGASCNALTQLGSPVEIVQQASAPPPGPWGGDILPGTYVLTSDTAFTGTGGVNGNGGSLTLTVQVTPVRSSPDRYDAVYFDGTTVTRATYSGAVGQDGTIILTPLCPAPGAAITGTYASTGTELILQIDSESPPVSEILTKVL